MSEKQTKRMRRMARFLYESQPPNIHNRKSISEITEKVKQIHKAKISKKKI